MSFSIEVKEEITRNEYTLAEKKVFLSAVAKINGVLRMSNRSLMLDIRTENAKTAKLLFLIIQELYDQDSRLLVFKKVKLKKNNVYIVQIRNQVDKIMEDLEIRKEGELEPLPSKTLINNEDTTRAYLAGCFIASGSINSPKSKNYHLEISTHSQKHAEFINKTISKFDLNPKTIKRRNNYVIYLKRSEEISDMLKLLKANNSLLKFEDERITKDYFNFNNRLNICEVFNEVKTIETANRQIKEISLIMENGKDYLLDKKDKIIAEIRMNNPEANLQELADIYIENTGESISKSGINHRLRKMSEIAREIKSK